MHHAFVSETRRGYLRRYAIVLRLQDRGSPSVASPFGREKCHWHFSFIGLTPVGSAPASLLATLSETKAHSMSLERSPFLRHLSVLTNFSVSSRDLWDSNDQTPS